MAYKALYNKYRPQTFDEVVGQRGIVRTLKNAIATGKIAHAYLFSGPRGTGKTTMARLFAKALNCEEGLGAQCNHCSNCVAVTEGSHPDVIEIDAASNNGVDQVRELIDKVRYAPIKGRYKIYIIDEVHMMSQGAFNALLKTLEEPPEEVIFILATTEPYKVLPTILSRCQRFDFGKIEEMDIEKNIINVLNQEGVTYEDKAVAEIAALADGGMRDALSILEQVLAYCGNELKESDVLTLFGLTSNSQKIELLKLIEAKDVSGVLAKLDAFLTGGVDIKRLNGNLLDILKDLLIFQKTGDANLMSSLTVSEAQDLSDDISARDANKMIAVLLKAQNDFRNVSNVRSLFELTLLQLCSIEEEEISTPVVKNKRPVETKTVVPEPVAPTPAPAPKAAPTAADVPDFVLQQPVVEEKAITPEPPVEEAIDLTDIKNTEVEKDGDRFELADEQVTNIMVLGKDNREERRELTKNWKQIEALKGHPTIGNLATLLAEGHPFCLCKEALLLTFNFTRLKNQANVKANQAAISAMVEKLLGRKVFVYSLDRLDCNKYYTDFSNKEQLNKLPNKKEIQLELPKGE
ncbi:MAG: DNA polymerase III subunit gamma/tau [Candidatus Enteromonas sp.]|nr:DNA polymerase III subunit gamma/tau [Candidatus Enteromonas sp.]